MRAVDHRQHVPAGGALAAGQYFDAEAEAEIRTLAEALYHRADWCWAQDGGETVTHGWTPEQGFLKYRWEGYDEALLLYVLGLGSPTHPLPESSYRAWTTTFRWEHCYGYDYLYAGPLFIHQLSHAWIDFRGVQDAFMRSKGSDYFENSRRATFVHQRYAVDNPRGFEGYGEHCWGITASEGPGPSTLKLNGIERRFEGYVGRGVPYGPDDGTLAPWSVAASLPFAPEIVRPAISFCIHQAKLKAANAYGFKAAFNPTHPGTSGNAFGWWVSPWHFGLNEGPVVLMIENDRSGLLWRLMRSCPYIRSGLQRAGFEGGWLNEFDRERVRDA
ncbi:hypothetical protein X759_21540 [Mesorhizobium sp. LSHC420B00]|nr:hypothetical protein X759_21540 [Mesorhizobium sp. LSHC420B00]